MKHSYQVTKISLYRIIEDNTQTPSHVRTRARRESPLKKVGLKVTAKSNQKSNREYGKEK